MAGVTCRRSAVRRALITRNIAKLSHCVRLLPNFDMHLCPMYWENTPYRHEHALRSPGKHESPRTIFFETAAGMTTEPRVGTCLRQESREHRLNDRQSGDQDAENRDDDADYCSVDRRQSAFATGLIRAIGMFRATGPLRALGVIRAPGLTRVIGPLRATGLIRVIGPLRATGLIRVIGPLRATGPLRALGVIRAPGLTRVIGPLRATGLIRAIGVIRAPGLIRVVVLTVDARIQRILEVLVGGELLRILLQPSPQILLLHRVGSEVSQFLLIILYLHAKGKQLGFCDGISIISSFVLVEHSRLSQVCQFSFFRSGCNGAHITINRGSHGICRRNNRTRGDGDGSEGRE
ncbi:hypothetical protein CDC7B_1981 [Corynebacterium diphtheriae C7 (beta)]|nr:hypothetical protein CDC7B_1981 [Corynebacterium diphtheriae C7 (beta)]